MADSQEKRDYTPDLTTSANEAIPQRGGLHRAPPWWHGLVAAAFWAMLFIGLAALWARFHRGSMDAAVAEVRGQVLIVRDPTGEVVGAPGEIVQTRLSVRNATDQPLTIVGCRASCLCLTPKNLPLRLGANGESHVVLEYKAETSATSSIVGVEFYFDKPSVSVRTTIAVRTVSR